MYNQRFQRGGFTPNPHNQNPHIIQRGRGRGFNSRGNFGNSNNPLLPLPSLHSLPNSARGARGVNKSQIHGSRGTSRGTHSGRGWKPRARGGRGGFQVNQIQRYGSWEESGKGQFDTAEQNYGKTDGYHTNSQSARTALIADKRNILDEGQFSEQDNVSTSGSSYNEHGYLKSPTNITADEVDQETSQEFDYNAEADLYSGQFWEELASKPAPLSVGNKEQEGNETSQAETGMNEEDTNKEEEEEGDESDEDTGYCKYCKLSFNSDRAYHAHTRGIQHTSLVMEAKAKQGIDGYQQKVEELKPSDVEPSGSGTTNQPDTGNTGVQHEEEEDSDSDEDTEFCKYCKLNFTSAKAYHAHTRGLQHTTLVMEAKAKKGNVNYQKEIVDSEVLKVTIPEPKPMEEPQVEEDEDEFDNMNLMDMDEQTKEYIFRKRKMKPEDKDLKPDDIGKSQFSDNYTCPLCDCKCTGATSFKMHIEGKQHKANMEQAQKGGPLKKKKATGGGTVVEKDEEAKLMVHLQKVESPIIGLEFVTEFQKPDKSAMARYVCNLCEAKCDESTIVAHLIGLKHRLKFLQLKRSVIYNHLTKYTSKKKRSELNNNVEDFARQIEEEVGRTGVKVKIELDKVDDYLEETMIRTQKALKEAVKDMEKTHSEREKRHLPERHMPEKRPRYDYDSDYYGRPPLPPGRDLRRDPMDYYIDDYRRNPYGDEYRDRFAYNYKDPMYERMLFDEQRRLDDMLQRRYILEDPFLEKKRVDDILLRREYLERQEKMRLADMMERRRRLHSNADDIDYERLKRFENRPLPSSRPRYDERPRLDERPSYEELLARRRVIDYENKSRMDNENKSRTEPDPYCDRPRVVTDRPRMDETPRQPTLSEAKEQQQRAVQALREEAAKNPNINVGEVMAKLRGSMISSEDDAAMALEIANALTQALVQYRLEKAPREFQSITESLITQKPPAPSIPGLDSGTPANTHVPSFLRSTTSQATPSQPSSIPPNPFRQQQQTLQYPSQPPQPPVPQSTLQLKSPVSQLTYSQAAKIPSHTASGTFSNSMDQVPAPSAGIPQPPAKLLESIRKQRELLRQKLAETASSSPVESYSSRR